MFDYLQKFNSIPRDIKEKVSSPSVMLIIDELERKYSVDLAAIVMKVMVKELSLKELPKYLSTEFSLDEIKSRELSDEMTGKIFNLVIDYIEGRIKKEDSPNDSLHASKGANFFFSAEDEEEIKSLTGKIDNKFNKDIYSNNIDLSVEEVVKKSSIDFGSIELSSRFKEIIKTYIRGVRSEIDVKQSLLKPIKDGGLSFDSESVAKVMIFIKEAKSNNKHLANNKIGEKNAINSKEQDGEEKEMVKTRDVEFDLVKAIKERALNKKKSLPEKKLIKKLAPPPPVIINVAPKKEKEIIVEKRDIVNKVTVKKEVVKKNDNDFIYHPKINARTAGQAGKKRMDDVKHVPRVMSPIDELKYMDLISFRRLADNPEDIIGKILKKLDLLEEDRYSKRLEGIKAWRLCPVNKLYLMIGQEGISTSKAMDAIIEERKEAGKDYLSHDEFEAILVLNKKIRF